MPNSTDGGLQSPFRPGDRFDLPVPDIEYRPDHPLMRQMSDVCTKGDLDEIKKLVRQWLDASDTSLPRGPDHYPIGILEPLLYQAIRENHADIVDYLLGQGIKLCRLAPSVAISHHCSSSIWQVFLDHGLDINEPLDGVGPPSLAYVLYDESLVEWLLAHGADPNAEGRFGDTPMLRAVRQASLSKVKKLRAAGGSVAIAVPFICSIYGGETSDHNRDGGRRLAILRYVLDEGADPNAKKWAHNKQGYMSEFDWGSGLNLALVGKAESLAEELLRRGARTDVKTFNVASQGETALDLAQKYAPALVPLVEECRKRETVI